VSDGRALYVALAALAGLGMAVQSRINGDLGARLQDGIAAANISFGVGLAILLCCLPWMRTGVHAVGVALRKGELRWWQCLGGVCGGLFVAGQGLTVSSIGVAVFTVAVVAGQSASSLVVDRAGLTPSGPRPITRDRALGAAICVLAVLIAAAGQLERPSTLLLAVLPLVAGVGVAWQQGMNGLVRQAAGAVLPPTLINFAVGSATLALALVADVALRGWPAGELPTQWWLYLGGPLGILFIAVAASVVKRIGVLLLGLSSIAGQVCGAFLIDVIVPDAAGRPGPRTIAGTVLTLFAVWLAGRERKAT
jgi:bacterial/archaeal transporter family-2 protein